MAQAMIDKRKLDEQQRDRGKKRPTPPDDSDLEDNNDLEQQQQVVPFAPTRKEKTQKQQYPLDSNGLSVAHVYLTKKSLSLLSPETTLAAFAKTLKQDKNFLPIVHKRCDTLMCPSVCLSQPMGHLGQSIRIWANLGASHSIMLNYYIIFSRECNPEFSHIHLIFPLALRNYKCKVARSFLAVSI